MNYSELCKKIDLIFNENENSNIIIEGVKEGKNYFVAQGNSKISLSSSIVNFKIKNTIKKMNFFITIL